MTQAIIAIAIVALCGLLVLRGVVRALRGRKTGCGCAECPAVDRHAGARAPQSPPRNAA